MADLDTALAACRAAVDELAVNAGRSAATWTTPRAEGKWSPSQLIEHVARAFDESANVVSGAPSKFPTLPKFLRPIMRKFFFDRILQNGAFPKARTNRPLNPERGEPTPVEGAARLGAAHHRFERACRQRAGSADHIDSAIFGKVDLVDYVRFQELHARHHRRQMPENQALVQ